METKLRRIAKLHVRFCEGLALKGASLLDSRAVDMYFKLADLFRM